ncbi:MAG: CDP-alcohol phosphatidyltransferase family protein [Planctomycetota bacterium]
MPQGDAGSDARRPIAARSLGAVRGFAAWLAERGVSANAVSTSSMVFAATAGGMLAATTKVQPGSFLERGLWLLGAIAIEFRLIANLLDGLIAVEGGKASPLGGLFNEAPDRVSDAMILIGLGYAVGGDPGLGLAATAAAILTAYLRELGHRLGASARFDGPMAKPQRMHVCAGIALVLAVTPTGWRFETPLIGGIPALTLAVITLGSLVTAWRRTVFIASELEASAA